MIMFTTGLPVYSALKDVDIDRDVNMILHFNIQDTGISCVDHLVPLIG